jgi:hypothetical protein
VEYNSPLEEEITTSRYVKSHIDLLSEDASPMSPAYTLAATREPETVLDAALAFTANELKDGGQTPGPFEEMRRRMAGLAAASPLVSPATAVNRKRKRTEKKRHWVWTIGQEDDEEDVGGAVAALRADAASKKTKACDCPYELPTPSIERAASSVASSMEVEMSDTASVASTGDRLSVPSDTEADANTPTAPKGMDDCGQRKRDTPIPELAEHCDRSIQVACTSLKQKVIID